MLPEKILQSDLLDILFENRNKNYSAYALRRSYNKIMMISIAITLFVGFMFSVLQFMHHAKTLELITVDLNSPDAVLQKINPVKPHPEPQVQQHAIHVKQLINSTPVIAPDDQAKLPPTTDKLDKNIIGNIETDGKDNIDIIQPPAETDEGSTIKTIQPVEAVVEDKPLISAEVMPKYSGGINALIKFMLKNLHQPDDLLQAKK